MKNLVHLKRPCKEYRKLVKAGLARIAALANVRSTGNLGYLVPDTGFCEIKVPYDNVKA